MGDRMITIEIVEKVNPDGVKSIAPLHPFPDDMISSICDGTKYTVYQTGDELPTANP